MDVSLSCDNCGDECDSYHRGYDAMNRPTLICEACFDDFTAHAPSIFTEGARLAALQKDRADAKRG